MKLVLQIPLGVAINAEHFHAPQGQAGGQIGHQRGLAHAALARGHCYPFQFPTPFWDVPSMTL